MSNKLYPIIVDNREKVPAPEERVAELKREGVAASVGFLDAGDYRWVVTYDDRDSLIVVVERKSVRDLIASVDDGRLAHFLDITGGPLTVDSNVLRCLLLEGDTNTYIDTPRSWTPEQLDGVLVSAQRCGLVIVRSTAASRTAKRLAALWEYSGTDAGASLLRVVRPPISDNYMNRDKKAAVRTVMGLGIGWGETRSRAAIEALGSPKAVIEAILTRDHKAFKDIKGIGKKLVEDAAAYLEASI